MDADEKAVAMKLYFDNLNQRIDFLEQTLITLIVSLRDGGVIVDSDDPASTESIDECN